jgi:hypothetical protein
MELNRESQDRRDRSGRRAMVDRRLELSVVEIDRRVNLDRRTPYIRRVRLDRRTRKPLKS